jgi:hypothetical protein
MQSILTVREDTGQTEPGPLSPPGTTLRTSSDIGQERGWAPPPGGSSPRYGAGPPPGPTPQPQPPTPQTPPQRAASVASNVGPQFSGDRFKNALIAGIRGYQRARYFRHAGLMEGLGATLDPEHYHPRLIIRVRGQRRAGITGLDPQNIRVTQQGPPW